MTRKLRIVLVGLVVSLLSQTTFAQYAANSQLLTDTQQSTSLKDGQRLTNVGKTIMLSGASVAMMGLTVGTVNTLMGISGDDIDVFVISTAIGAYFGGMVALTGLPFYLSGKAKMKRCGSSLMTISSEGQNGYVTNVEAGLGLANTLSFHAARGYNFNEHLFLGGGVGCSGYLFTEPDEAYLDHVAVPVYANMRLTGGSKRVTPYVGGRLGCDIIGFDLYSSIEFGSNIRSAAGSQADSWWLGVKAECLGLELHTMGLTVGKSF
mgnify:FL=1